MNVSVIPEEERFYKNTLIMAQAIHESVKKLYDAGYQTIQPDLVEFAITLISSFNKEFLIQGFITNAHETCWDVIKKRDELFFVENASNIFRHLPMDKVNLFKDLFLTKDKNGRSVVPQSLKDDLWEIFDSMIKISIKYIHKKREPYSFSDHDDIVNAYKLDFFEDVNVEHHAKVWNVKLDFPPKI